MFGLLDILAEELQEAVEEAVGTVHDLMEGKVGTRKQIKTGLRIGGVALGVKLLDD